MRLRRPSDGALMVSGVADGSMPPVNVLCAKAKRRDCDWLAAAFAKALLSAATVKPHFVQGRCTIETLRTAVWSIRCARCAGRPRWGSRLRTESCFCTEWGACCIAVIWQCTNIGSCIMVQLIQRTGGALRVLAGRLEGFPCARSRSSCRHSRS